MHNNPKTLVFDIETFPMEVRVWQLGEQRVTLGQIVKDWSVAAWAAKWLNAPASSVQYMDTRHNKNLRDDKNILVPLWNLLDQADIVITQNGKNFDSRKLNARFIEYKMKPPSPYQHLDTYKIADRVAEFTSHKLEYLTEKLNTKYKKLSHKQFPGNSLWDQCLANNPKAWAEMKRYNIHDVLATEELYNNLKAWAPETAPKPFDVLNKTRDCGVCGAIGSLLSKGIRRLVTHQYRRLVCTKCGSPSKGELIR